MIVRAEFLTNLPMFDVKITHSFSKLRSGFDVLNGSDRTRFPSSCQSLKQKRHCLANDVLNGLPQ